MLAEARDSVSKAEKAQQAADAKAKALAEELAGDYHYYS